MSVDELVKRFLPLLLTANVNLYHNVTKFRLYLLFCVDYICIQLFQERLSEKVYATIPKGIVGGSECTVLQRNLKEWHERPWTYLCDC